MTSKYVKNYGILGFCMPISFVNSRKLYKRCLASVEYVRKWKDKKYSISKMARWTLREAINKLSKSKSLPQAIPKVNSNDRKIQTILVTVPILYHLDNLLAELNSGRGASIDRSDFIRWALEGACSRIEEVAIERKKEDLGV